MNFLLSDEQQQLFETVLRFVNEFDGGNWARRGFDAKSDFDPAFWSGLMDLGVAALPVPEADGGVGLEMIDVALVFEALGRSAAPGPYLGHMLTIFALLKSGTEKQKATWLPGLMSGQVIGALAVQGPDARAWSIAADGGAVSGTVRNVPGGLSASLFVVGASGGDLLLVELGDGVQRTELDCADRTRRIADIAFDVAPADQMSKNACAADSLIDAALILMSADAFGGASQCLEMAVAYAKDREQFGQPIGAFQGLKFQLAELAVDVEPARGLYWFAAHAFDYLPDQSRHAAAAAKAHICDVYRRATRATIEAHGGIGYTWEHDAQIYFKRAMFDFAWLGTPAEHRERQAALADW